ncbi:hypothetical protein BGZ76_006222 [Entomortierella beljakovae]|nr:hypothetical protein BGZ76_006222 [Entomortierella beljakovae]
MLLAKFFVLGLEYIRGTYLFRHLMAFDQKQDTHGYLDDHYVDLSTRSAEPEVYQPELRKRRQIIVFRFGEVI